MKRLLFDLLTSQPSGTTKFHGGGEYIKTIFKKMVEDYHEKIEIITFFDNNIYIDKWVIDLIKKYDIKVYYTKKLNDIYEIFEKEKIDIFYSGLPYEFKNIVFPMNIKRIGTVHGLRAVEKPVDKTICMYRDSFVSMIKAKIKYLLYKSQFNKQKKEYSEIIDFCDKIICDSYHTKYSIYNYFSNVDLNKIEVLYAPNKYVEVKKTKRIMDEKYILLIGCDRWIKNSYRALIALDSLFSEKKLENYKVVTVGNISKRIKSKLKNTEKFIMLDYVESEELESLYKYCDFFLYPTLNEGFGLPPLEAMKYNKTCIVSCVCSLQEVCGNAVYYVNPYDIYEIRNRIIKACNEKISKNIIEEHMKIISKKQNEDLESICEFIIGQ